MRQITGQITQEIQDFIRDQPVDRADAYPVTTYRRLVEQVAQLAFLNEDYLLFYRGQGEDFRNKSGSSTIYPTIYRGQYINQAEISHRFRILEAGAEEIRLLFQNEMVQGYSQASSNLTWKNLVLWSILQHYGVCDTPLLDMTHSLRVACSFAQMDAKEGFGYVYVFALPYIMNRISHNSEQNIVNIRLLSICPPEALRPYFQEGYLVGTEDITDVYYKKDELDFRRRLVAKFQIPSQAKFWGDGFSRIPEPVLYPRYDKVERLCKGLNLKLKEQLMSGQIGDFLQEWTKLERMILSIARDKEDRRISITKAIQILAETGEFDGETIELLDELRHIRDLVVHEPEKINQAEMKIEFDKLRKINQELCHPDN